MPLTYTALGSSNTCGHGVRRGQSFQELVHMSLKARLGVTSFQPSCIAAMGPEYPASCLEYFSPNSTTYATVEFTPNMGALGSELDRSTAYLEYMMMRLLRRRVHLVLVDLVPRPPKCGVCIETFKAAHVRVNRIARRLEVPVVTLHYNESTWLDDLKHLNARGHAQVHEAVVESFMEQAATLERNVALHDRFATYRGSRANSFVMRARKDDDLSNASVPQCVFGRDLESLVLPGSRGFSLLQTGKHREKPGLITTQPQSLLRLCLTGLPPSFGVSLALERSDVLMMSNVRCAQKLPDEMSTPSPISCTITLLAVPARLPVEYDPVRSFACETGCVCPHQRLSNGDWTLHFVGRGSRRATESYMHRVIGTHRGVSAHAADEITVPASSLSRHEGARKCDCVLTLRNTQDSTEKRARAKINGLVAGDKMRIGWANRFHMNLNPNVLAG